MQSHDRPRFLAVLNGLAAIKPGAKLTPEALALWWSSMSAWSIEEFCKAADHLARECEFFPNPYHFEQLRKAGRETTAEAWVRAVKHAASSAYRDGPLGDTAIDTCVRAIGGYMAIAMCDTDKLHFLERRFCEHFEAKQDAEDVREALPALNVRPALGGPQRLGVIAASAKS